MNRTKDIRIFAGGKWNSAPGQKAHDGIAWRPMKGGTYVCKDDVWYVYRESLNAKVTLRADGDKVSGTFQSLPSVPFRPAGHYPIAGQASTAGIEANLVAHYTDGTQDLLRIAAMGIPCDGRSHPFTQATQAEKVCYKVTVSALDASPEGNGALAYTQGQIEVATEGKRFEAIATVTPADAMAYGRATATPSDPQYGDMVTVNVEELDRGLWRFSHWSSGRTQKSYSTPVYGDYFDSAIMADASKTVDFVFRVYTGSDGYIHVEANTLQNRAAYFFVARATLTYANAYGEVREIAYEREIWLDGRVDSFVSAEQASELFEFTKPQIAVTPPWVVGDIDVQTGQGDSR